MLVYSYNHVPDHYHRFAFESSASPHWIQEHTDTFGLRFTACAKFYMCHSVDYILMQESSGDENAPIVFLKIYNLNYLSKRTSVKIGFVH